MYSARLAALSAARRASSVLQRYAVVTAELRRVSAAVEVVRAEHRRVVRRALVRRARAGRAVRRGYREGGAAAVLLEGGPVGGGVAGGVPAVRELRELQVSRVELLRSAGRVSSQVWVARRTAARAALERELAGAAVLEQRRAVARWRSLLGAAGSVSGGGGVARWRSRGASPAVAAAGRRWILGAVCRGGDLAGYANGRLPVGALCPLWGAPGEVLRAEAAAAFNEMNRAFADQSGVGLCVRDSYRDLAGQRAARVESPGLAAVPGRSMHGWGVAVDLCGGAERSGSVQHEWLRVNAGVFGWFQPVWAQVDGALPEPWHWEFAG